ncbi:MAG: BREX system Lon protease-like protein BrxL [Promethearchaeota archaeon]
MKYNEDLPELDNLDRQMLDNFPNKVVRKSYANDFPTFNTLPRYICEFLINQHQNSEGLLTFDAIQEIESDIIKYYPSEREAQAYLSRAMNLEKIQVIDHYYVIADLNYKRYKTHINNLNQKATVNKGLVSPRKYPELLIGGLWGKATFEYVKAGDLAKLNMCEFETYQTRQAVIGKYLTKRKNFSTNEWIDFLIRTIGLNPKPFSRRKKILYLCRLIPLVEPRTNILEMGPPGTGKSHIYENISFYSRVVLGGDVSLASLIYNRATRENGIIFKNDVICFDEVNKIRGNKRDIISKLQQIMASGHIERGELNTMTDISFVFQGNLDTTEENGKIVPRLDDHFVSLPADMKDSAFLDRFHAYLHGWEFERVQENHVNRNLGLISNYFAELLHKLRKKNYRFEIERKFKLFSMDSEGNRRGISLRDKNAIYRIVSGLIKLIYPHALIEDIEWKEIIEIAIELRQNIINEIKKIEPGLFSRKIGFEWSKSQETTDIKEKNRKFDSERFDEVQEILPDASLLEIHTNNDNLLTRPIPYWIFKVLVDREMLKIKITKDGKLSVLINIDRLDLPIIQIKEDKEPLQRTLDLDQDFEAIEEPKLSGIQKRLEELINNQAKIIENSSTIQIILGKLTKNGDNSDLLERIQNAKHHFINDDEILMIKKENRNCSSHLRCIMECQKNYVDLSKFKNIQIISSTAIFEEYIEKRNNYCIEKNKEFNSNIDPLIKEAENILPRTELKRKKLFGGAKFKLLAFDMNNLFISFKKKFGYSQRLINVMEKIKTQILPKNDPYIAYYFISKNFEKYKSSTSDLPAESNIWMIEKFRKMNNKSQYADIDQNLTGEICVFIDKYHDKIIDFHLGSGDKDLHIVCDYAKKYNIPIYIYVVDEKNLSNELEQLATETKIIF